LRSRGGGGSGHQRSGGKNTDVGVEKESISETLAILAGQAMSQTGASRGGASSWYWPQESFLQVNVDNDGYEPQAAPAPRGTFGTYKPPPVEMPLPAFSQEADAGQEDLHLPLSMDW
jgi:hypothetical protein